MRTKNVIAAIGCIVFLSVSIGLSQDRIEAQRIIDAKRLIQLGTDQASETYLQQAQIILSQCAAEKEHSALIEYYLGFINYNLGVVIYRMDKEKASAYLDGAVDYLEKAVDKDGNCAEAHALLASCYGMKISFSPFKGMWLGPKSAAEKNRAHKLSSTNPRVALLGAIGTYNTPSLFGGGKDKGFEELKTAAALFDRWEASDSLQPDWGNEQVYAWIGLAYLERNETILARKAFEKSLEVNPNYGWVKYVLMRRVDTGASSQ
jgi:tetratricopeptide (TPR) repeat protein